MKRTLAHLTVGFMILLSCASGAFAAGAAVDNETLQLTLPHVDLGGARYHVVLDFAGNLGDGLYWKYNSLQPTTVTGQCGGAVDANLNVTNICVLLSGAEFKVNLEFKPNPFGHEGLYWRLGNAIEPQPCTITLVKGGDECFDSIFMEQIMQCTSQCGQLDFDCQSACYGAFSFLLALDYANPTSQDQICVLPAGMIFKAKDLDVQNMLVIHEETFLLPAGGSKTVCVPTYCLNSDRHAPDGTDLYVSGGGATSSCLIEIINGVQGKNIKNAAADVQEMVWDCANNGTISQAQRAYLNNLAPAN